MPTAPPKHCPRGHPPFTGSRCPACAAAVDKRRPIARARGYTSKWDTARAAYLAAHPSCVRCGVKATVVDHVVPHRGDTRLFWDKGNWQSLCTNCHSSAKQAEERRRHG